jgi:hypothetical protein
MSVGNLSRDKHDAGAERSIELHYSLFATRYSLIAA